MWMIAFAVGFNREDGLIRLHFHHFLPLADFGSIFYQPFHQGHFFYGLSQFGNEEFNSHQLTTFRQAAIIRFSLGMA